MYGSPDLGGGQDADVWFKCWYCGQKNNIDKNALGGPDDGSGVAYIDFANNPDYGQEAGRAVLGGITHIHTAQQNGSDGNPLPVMNAQMVSDSGRGCAFCGSKNYTGDYP